MHDELERIFMEAIVAQSRQYSSIFLERQKNTMQNLSQVSLCRCQDSNWASSEFEYRYRHPNPLSSVIWSRGMEWLQTGFWILDLLTTYYK
jgi:hypothetical protein